MINSVLFEKQVLPLFNSTRLGSLANIFAAWLVYGLVQDTHQQANALALGLSVTILSLIRIFLSDYHLRKPEQATSLHLNLQLGLIFAIGIAWALFSLMLISNQDQTIRNMVYLINFGMIAGSIATLSVWLPAYVAYVLPQAVSIFGVLAVQNTSLSLYMAAAFFIFMIIMIATSLGVNRSYKHELSLNFKNKKLIDELNNEVVHRIRVQEQLVESKRYLEEKVVERTKELEKINKNLTMEISQKRKAEESLEYIAYHDELTGLPNKNLLVDRINHAIEIARRNNQEIGIIFLDLDRFKAINDSLGHIIGDRLIQDVAKRLVGTLREEDTISRNGGDEFVVVIQRLNTTNETIRIAQKIIETLTSIFEIDAHKIHIGASIGISVFPNDGDTALALLRNADTAMFSAKKAGGNRLQFYDQSMSNRLRERLILENELHYALERNEFHMVYQPQVDCMTGQTVGFEALLRWTNKELGLVGPNRFVPLLEETGLIYSVGEWVIKEVIKFIHSGNAGDARIAVNLSALQFGDMSLVELIKYEITRTGIDPARIEFEITESLLINDFEKTEIFLVELHNTGCSIALDDFGTGYTSMIYLTRLPFDSIKVDQCFIRDIDTKTSLKNIVKAIVTMSRSLGMKNIFEGVETEAELEVIKNLKGTVIQGFLYSKPLTVEEVKIWLHHDRENIRTIKA